MLKPTFTFTNDSKSLKLVICNPDSNLRDAAGNELCASWYKIKIKNEHSVCLRAPHDVTMRAAACVKGRNKTACAERKNSAILQDFPL
jgi:hypothetical protein